MYEGRFGDVGEVEDIFDSLTVLLCELDEFARFDEFVECSIGCFCESAFFILFDDGAGGEQVFVGDYFG